RDRGALPRSTGRPVTRLRGHESPATARRRPTSFEQIRGPPMEITASLVKELRERTGAGMMECKKALTEHNGDVDAAAEALRKSGLAKADKKASRVAAEGRIVSAQ